MGVPEVTTASAVVQNWKPVHTQMVVMHFAGVKNKDIAKEYDYSEVRVYQLLQSPQAQRLIETLEERHKNLMMTGIGDKMLTLAERSLRNIEATVKAEIPADSPRKVHQDKVGFELLDRVGYAKGAGGEEGGGLHLSPDGEKKLIAAAEKALLVQQKHGEPVEDASYEVVKEDEVDDSG